jgi:hypothetical protein
MAFERFEKPGERLSKKISVWKQGVIHVSKGTMNAFALAGLKFCTLHYDREGGKVGMQFVGNSNVPGAVKLSFRDVGAVIPAKSFFDFFEIKYNPSRQYILEQDQESGLLVFDLGMPVDEGYTEHPDGKCSEEACRVLFAFIEEHKLELTPEASACVGRYLFECGAYLNWGEKAMSQALSELFVMAKDGSPLIKPRIPLEKSVYDILTN